MPPEKGPRTHRLPDQELLQENRDTLEAIKRKAGIEHALEIARKAEDDVELFIERELRSAAEESTGWLANELPRWESRLAEIREFIAENAEDGQG